MAEAEKSVEVTPNTVSVTDAPKPGWKSSEFYLSTAAMLLGVLMASGIIHPGTAWDKAIGLAVTALAGMGYTVSRAIVKGTSLPPVTINQPKQ